MACNNDGGERRNEDKCDKIYDKWTDSSALHFSTTHFVIPDTDMNEGTEDAMGENFVIDLYGNLDIEFISE